MQSSSLKGMEQTSALDQDHRQRSSKNCACQTVTKGLARPGESQTRTVPALAQQCSLLERISIAYDVCQNKNSFSSGGDWFKRVPGN